MRKDMNHVISDRVRTGGNSKTKNWKGNPEEAPVFESGCRKKRYRECKQKDKNLSPIKRWLCSHCGQPWNDVYGEACEILKDRDIIKRMVVTETQIINGKLCDSQGISIMFPGRYWECFYVDNNGLLQEVPKRPKYKKPAPKWLPGKDENHQLHCIDGVWYEVTLVPYPQNINPTTKTIYRDVVLNKTNKDKGNKKLCWSECFRLYGKMVYGIYKRQLSKKECRKLRQKT